MLLAIPSWAGQNWNHGNEDHARFGGLLLRLNTQILALSAHCRSASSQGPCWGLLNAVGQHAAVRFPRVAWVDGLHWLSLIAE